VVLSDFSLHSIDRYLRCHHGCHHEQTATPKKRRVPPPLHWRRRGRRRSRPRFWFWLTLGVASPALYIPNLMHHSGSRYGATKLERTRCTTNRPVCFRCAPWYCCSVCGVRPWLNTTFGSCGARHPQKSKRRVSPSCFCLSCSALRFRSQIYQLFNLNFRFKTKVTPHLHDVQPRCFLRHDRQRQAAWPH